MTSSNDNPFVMPGMGQSNPDFASNPLMASMEMMRQAWVGLTGPGGLAQAMPVTPPFNPEELDKRIAELKSVEGWLSMNLSMLSSTIQGMEVQRATIHTLRSFADAMSRAPADIQAGQSPLEAMLGIHRAGAGAMPSGFGGMPPFGAPGASAGSTAPPASTTSSAAGASGGKPFSTPFSFGTPDDVAPKAGAAHGGAKPGAGPSTANAQSHAHAPADSGADAGAAGTSSAGVPPSAADLLAGAGMAQSASQAWFDLLQDQFKNIATATAATMPQAGAAAGDQAAKRATQSSAPAAQPRRAETPAGTAPGRAKAAKPVTASSAKAAKVTKAVKTAAKSAPKKAATRSAPKPAAKSTVDSTAGSPRSKTAGRKV